MWRDINAILFVFCPFYTYLSKHQCRVEKGEETFTWEKKTLCSHSSWSFFICFANSWSSRWRPRPLITIGSIGFGGTSCTIGLNVHSLNSSNSLSACSCSIDFVFCCHPLLPLEQLGTVFWSFVLFLCHAKDIPKSQYLKREKRVWANNQWFCSWITLRNLRRFWRIRSKLWCDLWTLTCSPKQFGCFNNHLLMATTCMKLEKKQKALQKKNKFLY